MSAATTYAELVRRAQPRGWYRLEEASGAIIDASGYAQNGATEGSGHTRQAPGMLAEGGYGITLNGSGGLTFGDVHDMGLDDFTVELLIKTAADYTPAEAGIIGKYDTAGGAPYDPYWELTLTDDGAETGRVRAAYHDGTGILNCYGPHRVNDGAGHHVIAVFDRDAGITVWSDGEARFFSGKREANMNTSGVLRVGGNGSEAGVRIAATFDEIVLYAYAFADEQALRHHYYVRQKVAAAVAFPTGLAAKPPLDIVEVDWERDPARVRYRRQVLADAPDNYWPFDGATDEAKLDDQGVGTELWPLLDYGSADADLADYADQSGEAFDSLWTTPSKAHGAPNADPVSAAIPAGGSASFMWVGIWDVRALYPDGAVPSIIVPAVYVRRTSSVGTAPDVRMHLKHGPGTGGYFALSAWMPITLTSFSWWSDFLNVAGQDVDDLDDLWILIEARNLDASTRTVELDGARIEAVSWSEGGADWDTSTDHKLGETADDVALDASLGQGFPFHTGGSDGPRAAPLGGSGIEAWLEPDANPAADALMFGYGGIEVSHLTNGKLEAVCAGATVESPNALPLGIASHAFAIYDEEFLRLFIDGQEVDNASANTDSDVEHGLNYLVNPYDGGGYKGRVDEVAYYSHPLPVDRPLAHFRSAFDTDAEEVRWTTINHHIERISRRYGRQNELGNVEASELRIAVTDSDRSLEPQYEGSPYYPNVRVNRPIRHRSRYPANLAEDPLFTQALDTVWEDTVSSATVTTNVAGQSPPVGTTVVRAVPTGTGDASLRMVERIPVTPGAPVAVSFYAKRGAGTAQISALLHEYDLRNRDHGARPVAEVAAPVAGLVFPDADGASTSWQRYGAVFQPPHDILEGRLELVLLDGGTATVYAVGVQIQHGAVVDDFDEGAWWPRFLGVIEGLPSSQPSHRRTAYELTANDGRGQLLERRVYGPTIQQDSGERIGVLLDRALWPDDRREIDPGDQVVIAYDYGDAAVPALPELEAVADSELGVVFLDQAGDAVFHDGGHRYREQHAAYGQARFDNDDPDNALPYARLTTDNGEQFIYSEVRVTPEATDPSEKSKDGVVADFGVVPAGASAEVTVIVAGAKLGDAVTVHPQDSLPQGVTLSARVVDTNEVVVVAVNARADAAVPPVMQTTDVDVTVRVAVYPAPILEGEQYAIDPLSRKRYEGAGPRVLSRNTMLTSTTAAKAQAETLLARYREPRKRVPTLELEPARDPRLWPVVLGLEFADLVTVCQRPQAIVPRLPRELVMSDDPALYLMLEEPTGTVAVDEVGRSGAKMNGLSPGTYTGGSPSADSPYPRSRRGSRYLDGTDVITVGDVPAGRLLGDYTIDFWIKPDAGSQATQRNVMAKGGFPAAGELWVNLETNGALSVYYGNGVTNSGYGTAAGAVDVDEWQHFAAVRDLAGMTGLIYRDGLLVSSDALTLATPVATTDPLLIGDGPDSPYKGHIAHVAIYPYVLSADRIAARANAAATGVGLPGDELELLNAWLEGLVEDIEVRNVYKHRFSLALSS